MAHRWLTLLGFAGLAAASACGNDSAPAAGALFAPGATGGTGTTAGSSGGTGGQSTPPPEKEADASYSAPVVSGHFIWSANPLSGKVALIDATSLRVTTTDAGLAPTYVAALGASNDHESSAIVLNVGSDTASVLHALDGVIDVQSVPVHAGANRMTVSDSGRWALVWSDATLIDRPDPTEGLQDVTVLDLAAEPAVAYPLTVGYRPSRVSFGTGEKHAYFVTEPGVSVVDLPKTDPPSVARDVAVTADPADAASVRDVTVTPDGRAAVVRHEGRPNVSVISLDDGAKVDVTLPGPVTDLDLAPDGKIAYAVMRSMPVASSGGAAAGGSSGSGSGGASAGGASSGGSASIPETAGASEAGGQSGAGAGAAGESAAGAEPGASGAPANGAGGSSETGGSGGATTPSSPSYVAALELSKILDDPSAFEQVAIDDVVGSIVVAPSGDRALLYTNAAPSDHVVIFDTGAFEPVRTVLVQAPVEAVLASPDGLHAVALLNQATGSKRPGGFSLIPLTTSLAPKIVGTDAPPQSVAIGKHQALITVDGTDPVKNVPVHAVYLAELPGFGTKAITLASPPLSTGLIPDPDVNRGFVAQSHPEGRITFVDLDTGQPQTLTGFELASRVVQGD